MALGWTGILWLGLMVWATLSTIKIQAEHI
jgi:hypothetical protein